MTPFGVPRGTQSAKWAGTKGFVGGTIDATGLTHIGAREYDPTTGRFVSVDPMLEAERPRTRRPPLQGHQGGQVPHPGHTWKADLLLRHGHGRLLHGQAPVRAGQRPGRTGEGEGAGKGLYRRLLRRLSRLPGMHEGPGQPGGREGAADPRLLVHPGPRVGLRRL
ncbi:RHS repeat-associated core domain-containing protein [Streptomyces sp. NPDC090022]|uniref:RHS repeat-associated core domain-containing protein n=1 Tax=Streptomyces sp. NPDC090022 TaxID=3365920 RepID=UPI00382A519B